MSKTLVITQGDIFALLCRKDRRSNSVLAAAFGYHVKTLSKLTRMTMLPNEAIERACAVFDVDQSVFDTGQLIQAVQQLGADNEVRDARFRAHSLHTNYLEKKIEALEAEGLACKAKIEALSAEVKALTEENVFLRRHPN